MKRLLHDVIAVGLSKDGLKALFHTPLYANALYIMLSNVANAIFGLVFWIVAARFYSTGDIGLGTAVLSAASLLATFSGLGFGYGLIRFLKSSEKPVRLINSSFTIVASISIAAALIFVLGLGLWAPKLIFIREHAVYFASFVLFVSVGTLSALMDQSFVANRRAGFIFGRNLAFNLVRLVLIVALASILHSFGIFASWGMAVFVSLLVGMFLFLPRAQPGYRPAFVFDRKLVGGVFRFSFANYVSDVLGSATGFILPILVVNMLSAESNAYFYIAWMMGGILNMIPSAVSTSLFAEGSHEEGGMQQHVLRSIKMTMLILTPAVILLLARADKFLWLFKPEYAQNAATLMRLLTVSSIPVAINSIYCGIKRVERKLKPVIILVALNGALTIGLSYALMPRLGINGIGIAWLASQSFVTVVIGVVWLKGRLRG
jgi:O-antigen/teichoic acid export membrane protein